MPSCPSPVAAMGWGWWQYSSLADPPRRTLCWRVGHAAGARALSISKCLPLSGVQTPARSRTEIAFPPRGRQPRAQLCRREEGQGKKGASQSEPRVLGGFPQQGPKKPARMSHQGEETACVKARMSGVWTPGRRAAEAGGGGGGLLSDGLACQAPGSRAASWPVPRTTAVLPAMEHGWARWWE